MGDNLFTTIGSGERLADRVVDEVQQMIVDGRLQPGMKLPTEYELAEQLGVSRTVIREAVRVLQAKGLVASRQGVGTTVREITRAQVVEPLALLVQVRDGGVTLDQLYEVRALLEVEVAGLAARHATASDVEVLHQIVDDLAAVQDDVDVFAAREADFHQALGHATQNPLLELLLGVIRDLLERYIRIVLVQLPHTRQLYVARHRKIAGRVAAHDEVGARAEMAEHLGKVKDTMQQLFVGDEFAQVSAGTSLGPRSEATGIAPVRG